MSNQTYLAFLLEPVDPASFIRMRAIGRETIRRIATLVLQLNAVIDRNRGEILHDKNKSME